MCFAYVYYTNTKHDTSCNLYRVSDWANDGHIVWLCYENIGGKGLSQGQRDILPSSGTEPRVDNLLVANLRSYSLSCSAASWKISVKSPSQVMPGVGIELATLRLLFDVQTY